MKQPKSEDTKQKIKAATNRDAEYLAYLRGLVATDEYKQLPKVRAKQQFIDEAMKRKFGPLSSTTLTKIRKLLNNNNNK